MARWIENAMARWVEKVCACVVNVMAHCVEKDVRGMHVCLRSLRSNVG
jgi:hypothetical protein